MNPSDSKKLEEIERSVGVPGLRADLYILPQKNYNWLISRVKEQRRAMEHLWKMVRYWHQRADVMGDAWWTQKERVKETKLAFDRYGQHLPNCALPEQKCNCGFHEACQALEAGERG